MTRVLTPLELAYIDGDTWRLTLSFACETDELGRLDIPAGFVTDFNSVPRVLWNILPPTEAGEPAIAHDWLYRYGKTPDGRPVTRDQADAVYQELLAWIGSSADRRTLPDGSKPKPIPLWRQMAMYLGVRAGGRAIWNQYRAGTPFVGAQP